MPANFPANPTTNQVYVYNGTSWVWTGQRWQVQLGTVLVGATGPVGATGASANLLSVTSNIVPNAHQVYDLGTNTQRWRDLYLSGNSFYLGNTILTSTGNTLQLPAGSTIGGIPVADTGQVTQIASTASPKIANVKVTDNSWTVLDDTAIDTAGGYIVINGAGFVSVPQVYINAVAATSVSYVNSTQLRVQVPAFAAGTYPLYVINSDGGTGILVPGISFSGFPNWSTPAAGNVGLNYETDTITPVSLSASSNSAVTYFLASGALPPGVTLSGSTISGTTQSTASNTTYNFTIEARDAENQSTLRAFSITVNTDVVSWATPANAAVISGYEYGTVSQSLSASSLAGKSITYSGSNLPGNIQVTGTNVAGNLGAATNATTASNTAATITATANITARTANRTIFFVANPDQVTWASPTSNGVVTGYEFSNLSAALSATSAAGRTVAYSSGDLPTNITITGSTLGGLLGAVGNASSNLTATAATTNRANTIPVTIQTVADVVTWSTPTNSQTISIDATSSVNQTLAATSAAGKTVSYSANNLPTGLSVVGSAVTGTPSGYTSSTTVSSNLTATAATTNRSSTISITWSINLAITFVTDALFANVSLLLNAAANASVISDASSNNLQLTPVGDVRASTFSPYNTGWSSYFTGGIINFDSGTVPANWQPGSNNWTVEMWVIPLSTSQTLISWPHNSDGSRAIAMDFSGTTLSWHVRTAGGVISGSGTHVVSATEWTHLALVRNGTTVTLYINGLAGSTATLTSGVSLISGTWYSFGQFRYGTSPTYKGYASNFRYTMSAVYTANFTPATTNLTSLPDTRLLMLASGTATRNVGGTTYNADFNNGYSVSSYNPFNITNTGTQGSMYFDGTGDTVSIPANTALAMGTGDFTWEFWIYPTVLAQSFIYGYRSGGAGGPQLQFTTTNTYFGTDAADYITVSGTPTLFSWTHIVVVRAGSGTNNTSMYWNGVLKGQATNTLDFNSTGPYYIGSANNTNYFFTGYIADVRITKGRAVYPAAYPEAALTTANNTVLLLNNSVTNNTTNNVFLDSSPVNNTITRNGNATQGSFSPFSNGGWSMFVGSAGYQRWDTNTNYSGTDLTIECWAYAIATTSTFTSLVSSNLGTGNYYQYFNLAIDASNRLICNFYGTGNVTCNNAASFPLNTWVHCAVVLTSAGAVSLYQDGVRVATTTAASIASIATGIQIGGIVQTSGGGYTAYFNGYISNARIVRSVVYTGERFSVPTSPLTSITNTNLLVAGSNRAIDISSNSYTIGVNTVSRTAVSFAPFTPAAYNPAIHGGSAYFDGSGDYLATPATNQFVATGDFTVSFWFYTLTSAQQAILGNHANTSTTSGNWFVSVENGTFGYYINGGAGAAQIYSAANTFVPGQWYFVSFSRSGSTVTAYLNGATVGSITKTDAFGTASQTYHIGQRPFSGSPVSTTGWVADVRFVNGFAIPGTTVPTAPATAVYGTQLLLNFTNAGIWDASGRAIVETLGDSKVSTGAGKYALSSMYFDGNDYLAIYPQGLPKLLDTSGNFTVECWVRINSSRLSDNTYNNIWRIGTGSFFQLNKWRSGVNNKLIIENNTASFQINALADMVADTWYHTAAVRNGSSITFWIDGVLQGSGTWSSLAAETIIAVGGYGGTDGHAGYVSDFKITHGQALYSNTFVVPSRTLTNVERTQLLTLQNNQPHNNHSFQDSGPYNHLITRAGNASQGTFSPFAPGGWSYYFNGSSSLTPSSGSFLALGTSNYTIEFWIFLTTNVGNNHALAINANNGLVIVIGDSKTSINSYNVGDVVATTSGLAINVWNHVAIVRSGTGSNQTAIYINGVRATIGTDATNWSVTTNPRIGGNTSSQYMYGYLYNIRVVTSAVYTTNFTPPTSPLQAITGTTFLAAQSNRFVDLGSTGATFTTTGTPSVVSWSPFAPTASYSPSVHGGSAYFDGTGDYVTWSGSNIGTDQFTLECWFYCTGNFSSPQALFGTNLSTVSNGRISIRLNSATAVAIDRFGIAASIFTVPTMLPNTWYHLAACRDSSNNTTVFLNGTRSSTGVIVDSYNYGPAASVGFLDSSNGLHFTGYISSARIVSGSTLYNPTLTSITVPTGPFTTIANTSILLNFVADGIEDRSGRGVLETVADARHSRAVAKFANSSSMYFDGTGDYITLADSDLYEFGAGDFTVECWTYFAALPASTASMGIVSKWDNSTQKSWALYLYNTGSAYNLYFSYSTDGSTNSNPTATGVAVGANTWYHIAAQRRSTTVDIFLNGVQVANLTNTIGTSAIFGGTYPVQVGAFAAGSVLNGYIQDLRITKGRARYQPAAPTANLTVSSSTVLLVPGGTGNNIIRDASANNFMLTPYGDVRATNFTPYGTGWSAYFDGTSDYLDLPANSAFALGTGDFTIECWINTSTTTADSFYRRIYMTDGPTLNAGGNFQITLVPTSGYVNLWDSVLDLIGTTNVCDGAWHHIAASRAGTTLRLYVDGILNGSVTYSTNVSPNSGTPRPRIGSYDGTTGDFNGYISNLRVVKGTAVYTTNFIPPTAPLTAIANTSLLACHTNRFIDGSANNFAITRNGDTAVRSFNSFNITNTGVNGSMYFDGNGDYVTAGSYSNFQFGTGDFTVEWWQYISGYNGSGAKIWQYASDGNYSSGGTGADMNSISNLIVYTAGAGSTLSQTVQPYQWNHIGIARASGTLRIFVNGIQTNSIADSTNYTYPGTYPLSIGGGRNSAGTYNNSTTGYITDFKLVKGTAVYTANFTPATSSLTATTNTQLLTLQYRQPHNNHSFQDSSSNQFLITRSGNASQGTFSPFSPSGWSAYFDGSGDYLTVAHNVALSPQSQDFTAEAWIYKTAAPAAVQWIYAKLVAGNETNSAWDWRINSNQYQESAWRSGGSVYTLTASTTVPTFVWVHVALTKIGSLITMYQNGIAIATGTAYSTINDGTSGLGIGAMDTGSNVFTGYISNARLVKGVALYTGNFIPPTGPLSAVPGTSLLLTGNNFLDKSSNNFTVTRNGDTRVVAFSPFAPTAVYSPAVHGGSAYFDGTGDNLLVPANNVFDIAANQAFTWDCWFYTTSASAGQTLTQGGPQTFEISFSPGASGTFYYGKSGAFALSGTANIPVNSWNHVAIARNTTGNSRVWINGASVIVSTTDTGSFNNATQYIASNYNPSNYITGYIGGFRMIKGTAVYDPTQTTITIPTAPFTAVPNTQLLLNFTDAAVADQDASNVLETLADAREVNFGPLMSNYSVYFDGNGDYLSLADNSAFAMGSGNWTLECWLYLNSYTGTSAYGFMYDGRPTSTNGWYLTLYHNNGVVRFFTNGTGVINSDEGTIVTLAVGQWYHIAVSKSGNATKMFINGSQTGNTYTDTNTYVNGSSRPFIGANGHTLSDYLNGYISNLRVIKGTALYTTNFTPSTTPLTAVPGTSLLICHANRFRDASTNNFTVTRNGDAKVTDFSPFGAQVATPPSVYFDGTGDYAKLQSIPTMNLGTANFTIEAWVYPTSSASGQHVFTISADSYSTNSDWGVGLDLGSLGVSAFIYNGNTGYSISASSVLTLNAWNHIAWTRANGTGYAYVNAVQVGTASQNVAPNYNASWSAKIGYAVSNYPRHFYGYISDLRVTPGQVLYGGFEPPTQAFPTR